MMQSKEYWVKRALQREADAFQSTGDTIRRLRGIYDLSAARLVKAVKAIFDNFMKASGVTDEAEAKKLLTAQESAAVMDSLREEYARSNAPEVLAKLNAPAYAYRISRLQVIRQAIDAEAEWLNAKELAAGAKRLSETYDAAYYQTMYDRAKEPEGIPAPGGAAVTGPSFSPLSSRDVTEALNNRWKGENYSDRVWKNTHLVAKEAGKIIDAGLTSGATVQQMSHDIMDLFDVAYYAAARLVRTELNRMHNDATLKAYKTMGVEWYEYLATLDARTCSVCGALDGKHFKVFEAQTGVNLPPMHPNDRCTTVAYYPGEESGGMRTARDPETGRNYKVPAGKTYEQWRKDIAEKYGADTLEKAQKRYRNLNADAAEQRKMLKVLPKEVPPKIADFQDLKYNEPEKWGFVQLDFQRQNRLKLHPELVLPNAKVATAADAKFTGYLFNPKSKTGWPKGVAITDRLGYDASNWEDLRTEILKHAPKYPAQYISEDSFGKKYEQKMVLYGQKSTPANVIVGWKIKDGATWMTTCYIKEVK
jgi:SPP1 gp7 family putative phage head morphogenesis protein